MTRAALAGTGACLFMFLLTVAGIVLILAAGEGLKWIVRKRRK